MEIRKVTLIGLGAMGVFFAPKLDSCLGGGNFRVLAEGERRKKIQTRGVTINGATYHFPVITPETEGDPAVYGWDHVLYSFMRVSIVMTDGVVNYDPEIGQVHFGEARNEELSERVRNIKELFDRCGIKYGIDQDMIRGMWFKFMCNIGENMTCAMLGVPFGAFQVSDHANAIRYRAMREVIKIANRLGINLGEADIERQEATIRRLPFANKPSTFQDLENGRVTEIEMFAGKVVSLGLELGIDTPVSFMFYHGIKTLEEKNLGKFEGISGQVPSGSKLE